METALARLDGVHQVSAGWLTDSAVVVMEANKSLTQEQVDRAVAEVGFRVRSLARRTP